jgi:hypothetical protein
MKIIYKKPEQLMPEILFQQFQNNEYFKFTDFAQQVNAVKSQYPIDADMVRNFIYKMIDENIIVQEYVGDEVNQMTPEEYKVNSKNKSIRFKLIAQQP